MPDNEILRQRAHIVARFLNLHRLLLYAVFSFVAVFAVITNALKNYSNFYSVAIFLSKSSRSVLALANFGFLLALLCGHSIQRIFFGSLRPNEVERLYDRLWFFITESLLAFTIFRDEFDTPFALMFGFLLFVKSFHWLASDRIEWMDQRPYPGPPLLFHLRMTTLFMILWTTDCIMFLFAVEHTITVGVGGMVLFASEYGILMASCMNTISKYLLSAYDLRRAGQRGGENAPPWENKSMWVFYIELATDFLKLATYLVFFTIIITFYGLPLNIVRDVYITARSFISRLRALHRYQTATRNMDQRYPNATEEELTAMSDRTCIICREEMVFQEAQNPPVNADGPNTTPKKLPCGHIFHFYCLRSWLERQQSCPTCRRTVLDNDIPPTTRPGNAPAQPLPAAIPQQANAGFPVPNPNPLANPLGFVNRLFGPPAQVPDNPAFVQAAIPANLNQAAANNHAIAGQNPPGILIQYQIQYQMPRQQGGNPQPSHQARNLNPVPQFAGFPGPNGVWQPWPMNGQVRDLDIRRPAAQETSTSAPQPSREASASTQHPQGSLETAISGAEPSSTVATEASSRTPRNAAALAALRRLNGNKQPISVARDASSSPSADALRTTPLLNNDSTSSSHANIDTTSNPYPPRLIPLYDYSTTGPQTSILSAPSSTSQTRRNSGEIPATVNTFQHANISTPFSHQNGQHSASAESSQAHVSPSLTDEQLLTMDRLTREAIDERLRVLEGVSNTIYRCVDDLMRMRSALPTTSPMSSFTLNENPDSTSQDGENLANSSTFRRKEKQREVSSSASVEDSEADVNGDVSPRDPTSS